MKIEKVCLCSSRHFFDKLENLKENLEGLGYEVLLPSMKNTQDDLYFKNEKETEFAKIHYNLIIDHFRKIDDSDAILVCNYDKNEIKGYIGGNVLIEMAKAFDRKIPIFLLNSVPQIQYRAEILAMQPIKLKNLKEIKRVTKKTSINSSACCGGTCGSSTCNYNK